VTLDGILVLLFIGLMAFVVTAVPVHLALLSRIRNRHPSTWSSLGEPSLGNASFNNQRELARFVRRKKYLDLNDPRLNQLAFLFRWGRRIGFALFLAYFALFWYTSCRSH
jgi:hypothetical protein